ncbi:hypothetical protein N9W34_00450 [Rickettsiales bacterium]|nr:hypothetical protein [Rickettsiales bacterium]
MFFTLTVSTIAMRRILQNREIRVMDSKNNYTKALKKLKTIQKRYSHFLNDNNDLLTMFRALEDNLINALNGHAEALDKISRHEHNIEELLSNIDEIAQDAQRMEDESPVSADDICMEYYQLKQEIMDFVQQYLINSSSKVE